MIAEGTKAYNPETGQTATFTGGKWIVNGSPQMPVRDDDATQLKTLGEDANQAQWLAQKAQEFMQNQGYGRKAAATGPIYKDVGIPHVAENINPSRAIGAFIDPRIGQMESISNQAWTHMRPAGSGPMRMPEIEGFQEAFPNIANWGKVNAGVAQRLVQDAQLATQKHQFVDDFIKGGKGTFSDANAAWQAQAAAATDAAAPRALGAPGAPMQMTSDPRSPIGSVPTPGAPLPPQLTSAQAAILNWSPDKGLQP